MKLFSYFKKQNDLNINQIWSAYKVILNESKQNNNNKNKKQIKLKHRH